MTELFQCGLILAFAACMIAITVDLRRFLKAAAEEKRTESLWNVAGAKDENRGEEWRDDDDDDDDSDIRCGRRPKSKR